MIKLKSLNITQEQAEELPMVDLAFLILKEANTPYYYRDLMDEIARIKNISEEDMLDVLAQVYTEINIDGRFACVGNNLWGLKRWYPLDKAEDTVGNAQRPRIINDDEDDDLEEDEELYEEEEEDLYNKSSKRSKKRSKSDIYDDEDDEDEDDLDDDELDEDLDDDDPELDEDDAELEEEFEDEMDEEEIDEDDEFEDEDN